MTIGVRFSSGNDAIVRKPWSIVASWAAIPIRTWPSTYPGEPLAWKATKSRGVALARLCSRKGRRNFGSEPAMSGPPTRASGSARRTPSTA